MKQLKVKITSTSDEEFGVKKVTLVQWNELGYPAYIEVDFMEIKGVKSTPFYDYTSTGEYINTHGNLKAEILHPEN